MQRAGAQLQVSGRVNAEPGALLSAMLIEVRAGPGACSCRRRRPRSVVIVIGDARLVVGSRRRRCRRRVLVPLVAHFKQLVVGLAAAVALTVGS